MNDHHQSAKALILKAAENSGLVRETAKLLWFASRAGGDQCCTCGSCAPCELLDQLVEEFEAIAHLPETAGQKIFSPGFPDAFYISPRPAETHEVDSFVG